MSDIKPGMLKYCVIGNIVKERLDGEGNIKYGTASFPGGRKIYITRQFCERGVLVYGLNRYKSKYVREWVPLSCLENIRPAKEFSPRVLELMRWSNYTEGGDLWFSFRKSDQAETVQYADILNRLKAGDDEAMTEYREFMHRFYDALEYDEFKELEYFNHLHDPTAADSG